MADANSTQSSRDFTKTVTIEAGNTESSTLNISGATIVGLIPDANISGTSIKFQLSVDNATFVDYIANDATPAVKDVEVIVTPNKWLGLNATDFAGAQYIKLVLGTVQAGTESVIQVICRGTPA